MDNVLDPEKRKWMSPLTHLGESIEELRHLVRTARENLMNRISERDASEIRDNASRLAEELNKCTVNKWAESEAACEAAVAFVGGPEFFQADPKKNTEKGKRGRKAKKGRKKRKGAEVDDSEERETQQGSPQGETNPEGNNDPNRELVLANVKTENVETESDNMYERFNNFGGIGPEEKREISTNKDLTELQMLSGFVPDVLDESDSDGFDFENDEEAFASAASRYDYIKAKYHELFSDSDDDEEFNLALEYGEQSDGEIENAPLAVLPAAPSTSTSTALVPFLGTSCSTEAIPMPSTSWSTMTQIPGTSKPTALAPTPTTSRSAGNNPQSFSSRKKGTTRENNSDPNEGESGANEENEEETVPKPDFESFKEWAFKETIRKDKERAEMLKPKLMVEFNMNAEEIEYFQSVTSASMATVKGEVFQDEAVMKSSDMPTLAPELKEAAKKLQSLAIYTTHCENPSVFQWKSPQVMNQIQYDFASDAAAKRMEQQQRDLTDPEKKEELVDKEEDFLIQMLIYHPIHPDDTKINDFADSVKGPEMTSPRNQYQSRSFKSAASASSTAQEQEGGPNSVPRAWLEPKLAYKLILLGSQTIQDLSNAIHCENNYLYLQDVPHPDQYTEDPQNFAKNQFTAYMIFIHDTIYSNRGAGEVDFTGILNDWISRPPDKGIGPFNWAPLSTKLNTIRLRFGFPYLYSHLGGCDHILVFSKARLLNFEDPHLLKDYPMIVGQNTFKNYYCKVDHEVLARWAVVGYVEFPETPMFLCTECLRMYCYDKEGKKRGDFKLFPLIQMANML